MEINFYTERIITNNIFIEVITMENRTNWWNFRSRRKLKKMNELRWRLLYGV